MIAFEFTEHIDRSQQEVFAVLADPTRAVDYVDGVVKSVKVTDGPLAVGSVIEETRRVKSKEATGQLQIDLRNVQTELTESEVRWNHREQAGR